MQSSESVFLEIIGTSGLQEGRDAYPEYYFFCDEAGEPLWQDTYEYGMLKEEWRADADKECV